MAPAHPMRVATLLVLVLACLGCRSFPARLYVDEGVLEELGTSRYHETVRDTQIAGHLRIFLDYQDGPWDAELADDRYHRIDGPDEPLDPDEFDAVGTPWTQGLREGDLVLARTSRAQALALTLAFAEFGWFEHVGVLVRHEGHWHVCESHPTLRLFDPAREFAERFQGRVARVSLGDFLERYESVQVIRLGDREAGARLASEATASLEEDLRFDPYHEPYNAEVSCAEYVALLAERAGLETPERTPVTRNRSAQHAAFLLGYRESSYLTVDSFAHLPGALHVAWISRYDRREDVWILRECARYLHERFDDAGKLGDHLQPHAFRLMAYRQTTRAFFRWALGYFRFNEVQDAARVRRVLEHLYDICFDEKGIGP